MTINENTAKPQAVAGLDGYYVALKDYSNYEDIHFETSDSGDEIAERVREEFPNESAPALAAALTEAADAVWNTREEVENYLTQLSNLEDALRDAAGEFEESDEDDDPEQADGDEDEARPAQS